MKLISREYDPGTGITEEYYSWADEHGRQKLTIRRLQDIEGTLDLNKELYRSHIGKKPSYADNRNGVHKIATIPLIIIEKWLREDGFDWFNSSDADRRKKLNQPENRSLLVRPGKL